jgi:hypothetical protein
VSPPSSRAPGISAAGEFDEHALKALPPEVSTPSLGHRPLRDDEG